MATIGIETRKSFSEIFQKEIIERNGLTLYDHEEVKYDSHSVFYAMISLAGMNYKTAIVVTFDLLDGEVCYKLLSEQAGPLYYNCPRRILDKLTPVKALPDQGYAQKWRDQCLIRVK
jgi:hypothetical protein